MLEEVLDEPVEEASQPEEEASVGGGEAALPVGESKPQKKLKKKGSKLRLKKGTFRLKNVKKLTKGKKKHNKDLFLFADTEIDETVRKRMKERVVSMDLGRPDWVDLEVAEEDGTSSSAASTSTGKGRGTLLRTGLYHGPVKLVRMSADEGAVESEMSSWIVLEEGPLMSFFCDELPTMDSLPVSCMVPMQVLVGQEALASAAGVKSPLVALRCCCDLNPSDIFVSLIVFDLSNSRDNFHARITQLLPKQELKRKPSQDRAALARPKRPTNPRKKQAFDCVTIKKSGSNPPALVGGLLAAKKDPTSDEVAVTVEEPTEEQTQVQLAPQNTAQEEEKKLAERTEAEEGVKSPHVTALPVPLLTEERKPPVGESAPGKQSEQKEATHPLSPKREDGLFDTSVAKWSKGPTPEPIQEEILSPRRAAAAPTDGGRPLVDTGKAQWAKKRPDEEETVKKKDSAGGDRQDSAKKSPEGKRLAIDTSQAQWVRKKAEEVLKSPGREENASEDEPPRLWSKTSRPNSVQRDILSPRRARPTPAAATPPRPPLVDTGGAVWKKFEHSDDESDSESEYESESDVVRKAKVAKRVLPSQLSKNADRPLPAKPLPAPPMGGAAKRGSTAEAAVANVESAKLLPQEPAKGLSKKSSLETVKRGTEAPSGGGKNKFSLKKRLNLPKPLLGKPGPLLSEQPGESQRAAATLRSPRKGPASQPPQAGTLREVASKPLPPAPGGRGPSPFTGAPKPLPAPPGQQRQATDRQRQEPLRKPLPAAPRGGRGGAGRGGAGRGAQSPGSRRGAAKALPKKPDKNEIRRRLNMPKPLIGKPGAAPILAAQKTETQRQTTAGGGRGGGGGGAPAAAKGGPPSPSPAPSSARGGGGLGRGRGGAAEGGAPSPKSTRAVVAKWPPAASTPTPAAPVTAATTVTAAAPTAASAAAAAAALRSPKSAARGRKPSAPTAVAAPPPGAGAVASVRRATNATTAKAAREQTAPPTPPLVRAGEEEEEAVFPSISQRLALFGK